MITYPNAKINLGLNVVGRRADGYHDLETLFYPLPWLHDCLSITLAENDTFEMHGADFESTTNNLVLRAVRLLRAEFNIPPLQIVLRKHIPSGAGLGGGSADAAFTVRVLNELCTLNLSTEQMMRYASRLGADCAFFIVNEPQIARGIGNEFSPVAMDFAMLRIVVVMPKGIAVATAEAYRSIVPMPWAIPLQQALALPMGKWRTVLGNDFERTVFALHPRLAVVKSMLYDCGAIYAAMSGSGAALFGLFPPETVVNVAAFERLGCNVFLDSR